jgi:hypothetical protein
LLLLLLPRRIKTIRHLISFMNGNDKILYILNQIEESLKIGPSESLAQISVANLDKVMSRQDHEQIFKKLETELKILDIHCRPDYITEYHYRFYANKTLLNEVFDKYHKLVTEILPEVSYNEKSGVGYVDEKRFHFKHTQPEFFVFMELYKNMNSFISREKVLGLSGKKEEVPVGFKATKYKKKDYVTTTASYFINDLVKEIRQRTALSTDHLVISNGSLMLVGKKAGKTQNSPKSP